MRKNTWKLKTTKKKNIINITKKGKRGFDSSKMAPRERNSTKGGSRTRRKTPKTLNHQEENHQEHNK
jgi:hypothetical protein